jgi:Tfp pilus assembly protein PilX
MRTMSRKERSMLRDERGVALVVAVLVMITATFLGIAAVMTSDIEIRISGNQRCSEKAFYAADSGVDRGLAWLLSLGPTPPDKSSLPTMEGTKHVFDPNHDPNCYSRHRITDVNYTAPPPPGWEMTMFERRYYRVDSIGFGPANATKEIEVMASYVFPK